MAPKTLTCNYCRKGQRGYAERIIEALHPLRYYAKQPHLSWPEISADGFTLSLATTPRGAQQWVDTWARIILFMDLTGLRPSKAIPPLMSDFHHTWIWRDGRQRSVLTTEPYDLDDDKLDRLRQWCERNRWRMLAAPHLGMWYPEGGTRLVLLTPANKSADLAALAQSGRTFDLSTPQPEDPS